MCRTHNGEKNFMRTRFSNLNVFIRSLALSDVLGSLIGPSLTVIHINIDVLTSKLRCTTFRFFQQVFVMVTIYNLVVISIERYICTCRPTARLLSLKTVRKLILGAWVLGILLSFVACYPIDVIRVDFNSTHYTSICDNDFSLSSTRVSYEKSRFFILCDVIFWCRSLQRGKFEIAQSRELEASV